MLTINLLPESARKITLSPIEQFHRTPLMWLLAASLAGFALSLSLPINWRRHQLQQLNSKIDTLRPKKAEVEALQQTLQQLREQEAAFQSLKSGRGSWGQRLNILSDATPDGIWFTDFNLDKQFGLAIQGSAISQGGSEMDRVYRLVQDLKANPDFMSALRDIQIESIARTQDGEIEVVQFTLTCSLVEVSKRP